MGLRDKFVTDKALEDDGVWFDVAGVARFLCRRAFSGNKEAARAYRRAMQEMSADIDAETEGLSDKLLDAQVEVYSRHVVLDWTGVTAYDLDENAPKDPLPFSSEACAKLFRLMPDVFDALVRESGRRENYLASLRKRQAGN